DAQDAKPNSNKADSLRYLKLIDPNAAAFTFQVFDDDKVRDDKSLATILHGTFEKQVRLSGRFKSFAEAYKAGCGVFLTINEADGKARTSENIIRIRAVWCERDKGGDLTALLAAFPIKSPFFVESSPGKYHFYFLVSDEWPADEQGRADFKGVC